MVKLLRIDRRLIHGQIAFAWTAYLDVNCILVANDDAAGDDIRMATLRLAKPQNTRVLMIRLQLLNQEKLINIKL